ncbi:eukaryotic translation elongation factor 1 epsilon-1 [Lingula anatina]|uniref:Eukaryotic translation elongation factor 1 epsilon-1 n=1 Tax=Lingula anatina TaxID=7574 RepID=A0A1S3IEK7_LINAN|nr:eukaryotic translation elongation factor 1 epsilon-1 [Lingula anatina]|eukprot:XP_013396667.1 eukaryotic translation elongation factor 1 epsilon-1 [Lingula anatina]
MAGMKTDIEVLAAYLGHSSVDVDIDDKQKVPLLGVDGGFKLRGFGTICKYLAKQAKRLDLLGNQPEAQAAVSQWLEYRITQVDRCGTDKDKQCILEDINRFLQKRVYLVEYQPTLADLLLYYSLHSVMTELTFLEKQKLMHLSRWFNQVQHLPGIYQTLPVVPFQRNRIYGHNAH